MYPLDRKTMIATAPSLRKYVTVLNIISLQEGDAIQLSSILEMLCLDTKGVLN